MLKKNSLLELSINVTVLPSVLAGPEKLAKFMLQVEQIHLSHDTGWNSWRQYIHIPLTDKYCNLETYSWIIGQCLKLLEVATSPFQACTWLTSYKGKFLGSSAVHGTYVCIDTTSPIEDTTRPGAKTTSFLDTTSL